MKNIHVLITWFAFCSPQLLFAAVSFDENGKWETSFDYPECTQRGNPSGSGNLDCHTVANDGIRWSWGAACYEGNCTQVSADANNPAGSGNGFRSWFVDYEKESSGAVRVDFPVPQKELWIRWYMRYEHGVSWKDNNVHFNKLFYIRTPGENRTQVIPGLRNVFDISVQGTWLDQLYPRFEGAGWHSIYPTGVADGSWHVFEIHIKMDTEGEKVNDSHVEPFNGIARMWLNGELMGEYTDVNFSEMSADSRSGWAWLDFHNNQSTGQVNQTLAYVDYDDIVIYNQTPPNVDSYGNPFIGPIGWHGGDPAAMDLAMPAGLRIMRSK